MMSEGRPSTQGKPPKYNAGQPGYKMFILTLKEKDAILLQETADELGLKPSELVTQLLRRRSVHCEHHPDIDANYHWGCPECLREFRERDHP